MPGQGEEQVIPLAVFEEHDLNGLVGEAGRIAGGDGAHADGERALRVRERVACRPLPEGEHQRQRRLHLGPPPPRGLGNRGGKTVLWLDSYLSTSYNQKTKNKDILNIMRKKIQT